MRARPRPFPQGREEDEGKKDPEGERKTALDRPQSGAGPDVQRKK